MVRPLWIEVDLAALRNNLKVIKRVVNKNTKIVATIKQSAYGHGLIPVARELVSCGIDYFGVGSIEEAIELRDDGYRGSIIVLSAVLGQFASFFIDFKATPTISDLTFAKKLDKEARKRNLVLPAQVKIDTGMGRLGVNYLDAFNFIKDLKRLKNITLEGIYTHFPVADSDPDFTNYQIGVFNNFISGLKKDNISFKYRHCANSIGIVNYPNAHFNMVRPGLILYGIKPVENIDLKVKPLLSLKSKVIFIKSARKGSSISYGRTYVVEKPGNIATIAAGYADGYPWSLSNNSEVIINNSFFKVAGRVCMDHIMVDLGEKKNIKVGDEVILIGRSRDKKISVEDIAQRAKTIPYEIVSRLSLKIPRLFYQNQSGYPDSQKK